MLMNTFEELIQAMDGCVQRVKWGRTPQGTEFVAYSVLDDSPQLKVLEIPSCYHGVEFHRKDLKGRAKVYVYPNGNEGKRKPRRQPKL